MWETLKKITEERQRRYEELKETEEDPEQISFLNGKIWALGELLEKMEDLEGEIPPPQPRNPMTLKEFYDGCIERGAKPDSKLIIEYCNPSIPKIDEKGDIFID